jgi:hypothetical protein
MAAAITQAILLERTGRENGPDFMLNVEVPVFLPNSVINVNSNITEVLNVIAYLCNSNNRTDATAIDDNQSVLLANHGQHVPATGQYHVANLGTGASANTLWADDNNAATTQMINLDTFQSLVYAANHIPVGILARTPAVGGGLGTTYPTAANLDIAVAVAAGPIAGNALASFSNAVKQMIHILKNTRSIFGPKGWTALFNQVKGGGGKNHAKRTHRQHRRKYSSKHY